MINSSRLNVLAVACLACLAGLISLFPPNAVSATEDPADAQDGELIAAQAGKLIAELRKADASRHPTIVHAIVALGEDALSAVQTAQDTTPAGPTKRALARASTWIVVGQVSAVLRAGIETQLTFDGQYVELKKGAKKNISALLAMIDDESVLFDLRITACRALADIGDSSVVTRLRKLHGDLLLPPTLREEIGVVLAVFGDTLSVRRDLKEYGRFVKSPRPTIRLSANLQLAHLYYRIRDYERAVEAYEKILKISKDIYDARKRSGLPKQLLEPIKAQMTLHYYNAACSNTLHGNLERAKRYLRKAVEGDPMHFSNIDKDGDLVQLRRHESYPKFKKELRELIEEEEL